MPKRFILSLTIKRSFLFFVLLVPSVLSAQHFSSNEIKNWQRQSQQVTITRDNWGIPHIYGKTDADAVFGLMYAQCEDDFKRVELNYVGKLGRMAELKGKASLYDDLLIKILIDSSAAKADFKAAPSWLKKLLNAFADGINYYIYKHPGEKPALLNRFEPWYPLLWTDGSIGAINTADVSTAELESFYSGKEVTALPLQNEVDRSTGSNGFAIAPSKSATGNAMLYINPHVTFYFRPEVQVVSEEGLNAYGAVTWGQFFVYQGFNEFCGWMHTSSAADVADLYEEKISAKAGHYVYEFDQKEYAVKEQMISIQYTEANELKTKSFNIYATGHGPVMAKRNGKWISLASNNRNMKGLIQCWQRTKAKSFDDYKKVMGLLANTSNNTVYADAAGNIAYWHGNFMPKRNISFNWTRPVDGTTSATSWQGLHSINEGVHLYNPANGWLQNCNSTPFTVAGENSPKKKDYPSYMAPDAENFRGINAVRVLQSENAYTLDKLIAAGYDTYIAGFEKLVPALVNAYDKISKTDSSFANLAAPIAILRSWDLHSDEHSIATTLAIEWGDNIARILSSPTYNAGAGMVEAIDKFLLDATPMQLLEPLEKAIKKLQQDQGKWQVPWGEINRFQRISNKAELENAEYNDSQPSIPVGFVSSAWGMLPSYSAIYFPNTKKRYGVHGNSFICAVEFGKRIKAKSLLAGGESGHKGSAHFNDQALMYTQGKFKDVLFYKEDVDQHVERRYHPGD
ncbi:penicillin acylase family protein [soil metagenome]